MASALINNMHQFIKFLNAIYEHNYEETTMFNDGTLDKKKSAQLHKGCYHI